MFKHNEVVVLQQGSVYNNTPAGEEVTERKYAHGRKISREMKRRERKMEVKKCISRENLSLFCMGPV